MANLCRRHIKTSLVLQVKGPIFLYDLYFPRNMFIKFFNTKFYGNPSSRAALVHADRQKREI